MNVQSFTFQTLHFGLCIAFISRALALISNCKCVAWTAVDSTYIDKITEVSHRSRQRSLPSTCYDPYTPFGSSLSNLSYMIAGLWYCWPGLSLKVPSDQQQIFARFPQTCFIVLFCQSPFVHNFYNIYTWGARWPRGQCARRAIVEAKLCWSVIG
jgi:hypothetical protein